MVKALTFKGDKKPKKRKRAATTAAPQPGDASDGGAADGSTSAAQRVRDDDDDDDDDEAAPASDDSWVSAEAASDVAGPVLFVLPSDPPAALACDAAGKVFALAVENLADDGGGPATAEPHDVRQVWVASRIVGTEHFRFKGHHGKYLSCDKFGILTATSLAVSPLESFVLIATADQPGTFQVQTLRDTYLSVRAAKAKGPAAAAAVEVRGDAAETGFATTVRIRMQARFKPRLRAAQAERAREKISRRELDAAVGRRLDDGEVRRLKRARREGDYHEMLLDMKVKTKHDKWG